MKKSILSIISFATITTSAMAYDDVYIGGGLAVQDAGMMDTGLSFVLNGGAPIIDLEVNKGNITAEGEFTYSVIKPSIGSQDVAFTTLAGYMAYYNDINNKVYAKGRLGLGYVSADEIYDDGVKPSVGLGLGFKQDEKMNFYIDYTILSSTLSNFTFGIQLKI